MQRAGYHTAIIGKLHSHSGNTLAKTHLKYLENHTYERGFDYVFESSGRSIMGKQRFKGCRYTDYIRDKGFLGKVNEDIVSREYRQGGKNLYSPSILDEEDQFDSFVNRELIRWIEEYDSDKPFFLHASFFAPHFPLDPPESFFNKFKPEDMPVPAGLMILMK